MSEYNPIVIHWTGRAKPAGLSFLIVNLGVPWTIPINQCSRGIALNVCCSSSLEGTATIPYVKNTQRMYISIGLLSDASKKSATEGTRLTLDLSSYFYLFVYRCVKNDTEAVTASIRQTTPNLLNFTKVYPHQLSFCVIGVEVKCIAVQYFK